MSNINLINAFVVRTSAELKQIQTTVTNKMIYFIVSVNLNIQADDHTTMPGACAGLTVHVSCR